MTRIVPLTPLFFNNLNDQAVLEVRIIGKRKLEGELPVEKDYALTNVEVQKKEFTKAHENKLLCFFVRFRGFGFVQPIELK